MNQRTVAKSFELSGVGIHTGTSGKIRVHPAEANSGRVFRSGYVLIPAQVKYVSDTTRCTTLSNEGVSVSTVEHLLSALAGLNIDNALIEIEGRETPILDGSALPFVEAILEAGIEELAEPAKFMPLKSNIALVSGKSEMNAIPSDRFKILTRTDFDDWNEGDATVEFELSPEAFMKEIAPARTFAFRKEVEMLLAAGLAKGGSLDNALVIDPPNTFSSPLRVSFEWCSHKILDIIGDLALLDARPLMEAKCRRPGHRMNFEFAKEFLRSL